MRKTLLFALLALFLVPGQSLAEIKFFGMAKVKPTYYSNFDFQDDKGDAPTMNEGGWAAGEHIRGELRLGWKASGERWTAKMIAEADVIFNKNNADRSFGVGATNEFDQPNAGGEFGIERAELTYALLPQVVLETGWDVRALDIKTGGLLYGDDHPFLGFRGALTGNLKYELLYLPINNSEEIGVADTTVEGDWRVYSLKVDYSLGKDSSGEPLSPFFSENNGLTISPFLAVSDNNREADNAEVLYYGLEAFGQLGPVKPSFEIVAADGDFESGKDISSWAMFAGVELPVSRAFNPYAAFRYTQGDDDKNDSDVDGWVGITDIARFTPMLGMDGNILGEHLASGASIFNSPLYSYSPERAVGGDVYGGIGNGSSGNNPGQQLIAVGAKGDLSALVKGLLYKSQVFFIWYDETDNLANLDTPGSDVDDYAGTTFDLQVLYAFSKNFSVDYIFSAFMPGDGIDDQIADSGDDTAMVNSLTLAWTF